MPGGYYETQAERMYYFAYASNLKLVQMAERVPGAKARLAVTLPNYRLVFGGYSRVWKGGVASLQASRGDKVLGGIYEITEQDLAKLDKFEGYPNEYTHLMVTVYPDMGNPVEAVAFVSRRQVIESKPSAEYLACIRQGYLDWGLV
jgi:gamma-glutamylcyclotransferase (GGCT)/AIG2-like uncharacterized protein YtfP